MLVKAMSDLQNKPGKTASENILQARIGMWPHENHQNQCKEPQEQAFHPASTLSDVCVLSSAAGKKHLLLRILMPGIHKYLRSCLALRKCHPVQPQSVLWAETEC
jgi:hypothetical protein